MAQFPIMPLHTDAIVADTSILTNEEFGIYMRLLIFAWRTPDCSLPNDDKKIRTMLGISPSKWTKMKPSIMEFWTLDGDVWKQKKQQKVRQEVEEKVSKKSAAGKASAKARALKTNKPAPTGVATGGATERQQPKPKPKPKESPLNPPKGKGDADLFGEEAKPPPETPATILSQIIPPELAEEFVEHRRQMGRSKALSVIGAQRMVKKLRSFANPVAAVEDAIANGYQGVFERAQPINRPGPASTGHSELVRRAIEGARH